MGERRHIGTSTFTYDWADRLASVDLPTGFSTAVPTFGWRADGLIGRRTWDTGAAATFSYDKAKRPVGIDKGSLWFDQAYDRDGNVTAEARNLPGVAGDPGSGSQSFSYDALNRVTASSGLAQSQSYTYDLDGNRLTKTIGGVTHTSTYDRTDQLIGVSSGGSPTLYGYDTYGNLASNAESVSSVTTMTYDLGDKLTAINPAGTADDVTFTFDALGRFRTRVLAASTDTYSYAGTSEVVQRIANTAGTTSDSIVSPAGDRLGVSQAGTLNWFLPDLHGNVAASLSATEAIVTSAARYDPYGQTIGTGSAGGTAVGEENWKYQGRLDVSGDADSPLYDMSARFYSPGLGTFTQLDSVMGGAQNPLSMNRFLYAHANPATLIDPTGHAAIGQICPYGPDDCSQIAYKPPPGLTDGVAPGAPKPKAKPAVKDETSKFHLPPGGSIRHGVYNPDWQPGVNPIPHLAAVYQSECRWGSLAACEAYANAAFAGPRACGENDWVCLGWLVAAMGASGAPGAGAFAASAAAGGPITTTEVAFASGGLAGVCVAWCQKLRDFANGIGAAYGGAPVPAVPLGFSAADDFARFGDDLYGGLRTAGYDDAVAYFQGSSVTGVGYKTGAPFDLGRLSDFDVAIASPKALAAAAELGVEMRSAATRTGPLRPSQVYALGLSDLQKALSDLAGRRVEFMLFQTEVGAASRGPSIMVPHP